MSYPVEALGLLCERLRLKGIDAVKRGEPPTKTLQALVDAGYVVAKRSEVILKGEARVEFGVAPGWPRGSGRRQRRYVSPWEEL